MFECAVQTIRIDFRMVRTYGYVFHVCCHVMMVHSFESTVSRTSLTVPKQRSALQMSQSIPCKRSNRQSMPNNERMNLIGQGIYRRNLSQSPLFSTRINSGTHISRTISLFLLLAQWIRPSSVLAESSTTIHSSILTKVNYLKFSSILSTTLHRVPSYLILFLTKFKSPLQNRKFIVSTILWGFGIYTGLDLFCTGRRQRTDPTSEWGRYASHPSKRGLALMILMIRMAPFVLLASLLSRKRTGDDDDEKDNDKKTKVKEVDNSWRSKNASSIRKRSGKMLSDGLLKLGPLYIKIGQILSCRENLFPIEWKQSLDTLQDSVPAKSGAEALTLAYDAYGETEFKNVFAEFDDVPIAAASLGQVHKAKLRSNGATVAIKLQRSKLREIYDQDLTLMKKIATIMDKMGGSTQVGGVQQSWEAIFTDAETILYREIDYRDEAENARRFAQDFGLGLGGKEIPCIAKSLDGKILPSASDWMRTPYVYEDLSTEKVLVMEYVPSIKISNNAKLTQAGVSQVDREQLSESLARAYLRQFCVNKFFSTDPHPGNLGVEVLIAAGKEGSKQNPRIVFYDFGQACSLQDDQAGGILDVIEGIVDMDVDNCVTAFDRMGVLVDNADLDKVKQKVKSNFDTGKIKVKKKKMKKKLGMIEDKKLDLESSNTSLDDTSIDESSSAGAKDLNSTITTTESKGENDKVDDAEIMSFFTLPAEYAFVARAISQMDGVGKGLDPEFDFISASAPYLVEIKGGEKYIVDEAKKFIKNIDKKALEWQANIFRKAGFDAKKYIRENE